MTWGFRPGRVWLLASVLFHLFVGITLWRVRVPVGAAPPPLALHILPTLRPAVEAADRFREPPLSPGPVPRPYLRPPPLNRSADALMPGPFPAVAPEFEALRGAAVAPVPLPIAAATLADRVAVLPREAPLPVVE